MDADRRPETCSGRYIECMNRKPDDPCGVAIQVPKQALHGGLSDKSWASYLQRIEEAGRICENFESFRKYLNLAKKLRAPEK